MAQAGAAFFNVVFNLCVDTSAAAAAPASSPQAVQTSHAYSSLVDTGRDRACLVWTRLHSHAGHHALMQKAALDKLCNARIHIYALHLPCICRDFAGYIDDGNTATRTCGISYVYLHMYIYTKTTNGEFKYFTSPSGIKCSIWHMSLPFVRDDDLRNQRCNVDFHQQHRAATLE